MSFGQLFRKRAPETSSSDTANEVLGALTRRRLLEAASALPSRITGFIDAQLPVHLTVAMPPSVDAMAICQFDDVCVEIAKRYAPGARITVCIDGSERLAELNTLIRHIDAVGVDIVDLTEFDVELDVDLKTRTARCFPRALQLSV